MKASLRSGTALLCLLSALTAATSRRSLTPQQLDDLENMCDLQTLSEAMFCYCDHLEADQAGISNCWVYGDTRRNDTLWDTFHHQRHLHRLTINLRGDGSLDFVPSRVLSYTPELWAFEIKNAAITRVRSEAFSASASVAELILASNGIAHLSKHAFSDLGNLTKLNLGKNKVATLGRHVFRNLPKLKQLYLDRNELTKVRNGAFAGLDGLKVLELYDNSLEEVSQGTFRGLKQLERLDLHRNMLETIEDRTFAAIPNLKDLDLEENRIKYISEKGFSGLKKLMRLNLHDNKLLSILPGTFLETPEIFFLDIHQNVLDTLEEASFAPIMDNMRNITMYLFVRDNALHCDCRLAWLLRLRKETASTHVQAALDGTVCHMESGVVPVRLEAAPTPDPALETSTLGIGPPVRLVDLKVHELPCDRPLAEEPVDDGKQQQALPEHQQKQNQQKKQQLLQHDQLQKQHQQQDRHHHHQQQQQQKEDGRLEPGTPAAPLDTLPPAGSPVRREDSFDGSGGSGSAAAVSCWLLLLTAAAVVAR